MEVVYFKVNTHKNTKTRSGQNEIKHGNDPGF